MLATPRASAEPGHEWRRWIAENLLLGSAPASLLRILTGAGIAEREAVAELELALRSPYLKGAARLKNRLARRDWVLDIQRTLNGLRAPHIERRHRLPAEAFLADYYSTNQPVIITGMMDGWMAGRRCANGRSIISPATTPSAKSKCSTAATPTKTMN